MITHTNLAKIPMQIHVENYIFVNFKQFENGNKEYYLLNSKSTKTKLNKPTQT